MSFTDQEIKIVPEQHLILEHSLLHIPYEQLRTSFKTGQKYVERDLNSIVAASNDLARGVGQMEATERQKRLADLLKKAESLKAKMTALQHEEETLHAKCQSRVDHLCQLSTFTTLNDPNYHTWAETRLNRLLVDYLLRQGFVDTALELARTRGIESFVDIDVFLQCQRIYADLKRGSSASCLAWCAENKTVLRKQKSSLEFELRLQEFVELIRARNFTMAFKYSRKHLASHAESHLDEIQKSAVLTSFPNPEEVPAYKQIMSKARWEVIADNFQKTYHLLYGLTPNPVLNIALSSGLSALKTPTCYTEHKSAISLNSATLCPICDSRLNALAKYVPYAHAVRSSLIDSITGKKLDGQNEPVVLPSGRVYGNRSLEDWNDIVGTETGRVRDPVTNEVFEKSEVKKIYVM